MPALPRTKPTHLEFHGEINNRPDGYAGGAFGEPGAAFVDPAGGGDIEVDPRGVFGEFLDEPGGGDGATAFAGAGVADIGDGALDHFLVLVVNGHGPHFFAGGFGAFEELIEIFARGAEGADVDIGEGDLDGAGERGGVNDVGDAELFGVGEAVGEDEAAFCIGVDDFDGFAGHGDLDVAGLLGVSAGHIFGGGDDGDDGDGGFEVSEGAHGAKH